MTTTERLKRALLSELERQRPALDALQSLSSVGFTVYINPHADSVSMRPETKGESAKVRV